MSHELGVACLADADVEPLVCRRDCDAMGPIRSGQGVEDNDLHMTPARSHIDHMMTGSEDRARMRVRFITSGRRRHTSLPSDLSAPRFENCHLAVTDHSHWLIDASGAWHVGNQNPRRIVGPEDLSCHRIDPGREIPHPPCAGVVTTDHDH
nr:hypothetical protein [Gordonia sp. UCD-TK1]